MFDDDDSDPLEFDRACIHEIAHDYGTNPSGEPLPPPHRQTRRVWLTCNCGKKFLLKPQSRAAAPALEQDIAEAIGAALNDVESCAAAGGIDVAVPVEVVDAIGECHRGRLAQLGARLDDRLRRHRTIERLLSGAHVECRQFAFPIGPRVIGFGTVRQPPPKGGSR